MGEAENKATIETAYEAFGRGDIEALLATNAPDAVWVVHSPTQALAGEYKGLDDIPRLFQNIGENIEMSAFEMNVIAVDGDIVVARGAQTYTVKATGATVSGPLAHVFTLNDDGKVVRFEEWESND